MINFLKTKIWWLLTASGFIAVAMAAPLGGIVLDTATSTVKTSTTTKPIIVVEEPIIVIKEPAVVKTEPTYFAELDKNGIVKRVIVADQKFIDSGAVGNSANWKQTKMDGSLRKNYAGKGDKYSAEINAFVKGKESEKTLFNTTTARWELKTIEVKASSTRKL